MPQTLEGFLELFFPPACLGCAAVLEAEANFCAACELGVHPVAGPRCPTCSDITSPHVTCPRCAADPPAFDRAHAPWLHGGPVARAIHRFKYEDQPELVRPLAALLARELTSGALGRLPQQICAIPLHPSRLRRRKYDQAQLLASQLARRTGLAWNRRGVVRRRPTRRQVHLDEQGRKQNVAGAFWASSELAGQAVLLVDDVLTTGATARAAARAVRAAGARWIGVLTVARAP